MIEDKILIGFIGAILALLLKELVDRIKSRSRGRRIAKFVVEHLELLDNDFKTHVKVKDQKAYFETTQYNELAVLDFLYDQITSNIDCFSGVSQLRKTVLFFHHYKIQMSNLKTRLDHSDGTPAALTEQTYKNLLFYLEGAIDEQRRISKFGCIFT